jgi:hypothetical protein
VQRLVVRVWLADRPGALGQLASAIGSVGADVLSIDILEQGAGRAIDEIIVALPESVDLDQLVAAMQSVEAVAVEDVRPYAAAVRDHRTVALETAVGVVGADGFAAAAERLVVGVAGDLIADWVVVMGPDGVLVATGDAPAAAWIKAFAAGAKLAGQASAAEDVAMAPLADTGFDIVVGRSGRPLRAREREELVLLAAICATRR